MTETTSTERLLQISHSFAGLPAELRTQCARGAQRRVLSHGESIWRAGEPALAFTLIVSGLVKIARRTPDGGASIVALFGPRESIGDSAVLAAAPYPADALLASVRGEVLRLDAAPILRAMQEDVQVAQAMNRALLEHTQALQEKIRILSAGPMTRRLAALLLHLADRFGDELEDGTVRVPLPLSRGDLAELIGARVETTIRALSRWKKAALLETDEGGFTLRDRPALERLLDE